MSRHDHLEPAEFSHTMSMISQNNHYRLDQLQKQQERTKSMRSTTEAPEPVAPGRDVRSPTYVALPTTSSPTEILGARFNSWRLVIKALVSYFREVASVHEEIVRQQLRLQHAVNFPFLGRTSGKTSEDLHLQENALTTKFFLLPGNGSVQDLPQILTQYHSQNAASASKTLKELTLQVIPRLEDLRKDLLVKIKEIRNLASDFKNDLPTQVAETKNLLGKFQAAIEVCSKNPASLAPGLDPFLLHKALHSHIEAQVAEENFLRDAFVNLQTSGRELERIVMVEIQNALTTYAKALGIEAQTVFDVLITKVDSGILSKEPQFEWEAFVARDPNFIDPAVPPRELGQVAYPNMHNPLVLPVRASYLERRSKFLKSYARGWFVLTPNYIHEFKSPDLAKNPVPLMSLSLYDCSVAEHSSAASGSFKFVLHAKQNGIIRRGHNWVFRVESYSSMMEWYSDLKRLTSLPNPVERANAAARARPDAVEGASASATIRSDSLTSRGDGPGHSNSFTSRGDGPGHTNSFTSRGDGHGHSNSFTSRGDGHGHSNSFTSRGGDAFQASVDRARRGGRTEGPPEHQLRTHQPYPESIATLPDQSRLAGDDHATAIPYPDRLTAGSPGVPHFTLHYPQPSSRDALMAPESHYISDHSGFDSEYHHAMKTESTFHRSSATAATTATALSPTIGSPVLTPVVSQTKYTQAMTLQRP